MLELIDIEYKIKGKVILNNINLKVDTNKVLVITGKKALTASVA